MNNGFQGKHKIIVPTIIITLLVIAAAYLFVSKFLPFEITFLPGEVNSGELRKFNEVKDVLRQEYYTDLDVNKLIEGAIKGYVAAIGDRYTSYLTKAEWDAKKQKFAGEYTGIGISYYYDKKHRFAISEVLPNSPAQKAGIRVGDIFEKIDGVIPIESSKETGMSWNGKSKITVVVFRPSDKTRSTKTIEIGTVVEINAYSKVIDGKVGYLDLRQFTDNIDAEFLREIDKLTNKSIKGLIIDLRNNPGGDLDQVVKISDFLLPKCTIVSVEHKNKPKEFYYSDEASYKLPVTVIVNGNSASASEVLSGALQDNKRATLVGEKTFGKGLVQNTVELFDGSAIYYTSARYFTPNGICIHGIGIEPDMKVALPKEFQNMSVDEIPFDKDTQLQAALKNIKSKIK